MNKYYKIKWLHDFPDEAVWWYHEIDQERNEKRRIEEYRDGHMAYVSQTESHLALPAEKPVRPIEQIAKDPEFDPKEITKEEFEVVWEKAVHKPQN